MTLTEEIEQFETYKRLYHYAAKITFDYHKRYLKMGDLDVIYRKLLLPLEADLIKTLVSDTKDYDMVFAVYYYLLWNGYLSHNKKFSFGVDEHPINTVEGMSVSTGVGVCRNISFHFADILNTLESGARYYLVGTNPSSSRFREVSSSRISHNYVHSNLDCQSADKFLPVHAENVIIKDDGIYFYDPTNFLIYKYDDSLPSTRFSTPLDFRVSIFDGNYCINSGEAAIRELIDVFQEKYQSVLNDDKRLLLSRDYLKYLIETGADICLSRQYALDEFVSKTRYTYDGVAKIKTVYSKRLK